VTTLANAKLPVAFSGNGIIATASPNSTVLFWSADGKSSLGTLALPRSSLTTLAFGKDGTLLATGDYDGTITFWCP
jgi:WD40 repeat protein